MFREWKTILFGWQKPIDSMQFLSKPQLAFSFYPEIDFSNLIRDLHPEYTQKPITQRKITQLLMSKIFE